jgi:hypothetical protein
MYEIRQIEAWMDGDGWYWNTSYHLGEMKTKAKDEKKAFTNWLRNHGITFKKNRTRIYFDGDIYEIVDRKTGEPLFAAIPLY